MSVQCSEFTENVDMYFDVTAWDYITVVKTAHSFWQVNHDQKDRLIAAAYVVPAAIVPHAGLSVILHSLQ